MTETEKPTTEDAILARLDGEIGMRWIFLTFALIGSRSVRYALCPTLMAYSPPEQQTLAEEISAYPQPQTIYGIENLSDCAIRCRRAQRTDRRSHHSHATTLRHMIDTAWNEREVSRNSWEFPNGSVIQDFLTAELSRIL